MILNRDRMDVWFCTACQIQVQIRLSFFYDTLSINVSVCIWAKASEFSFENIWEKSHKTVSGNYKKYYKYIKSNVFVRVDLEKKLDMTVFLYLYHSYTMIIMYVIYYHIERLL